MKIYASIVLVLFVFFLTVPTIVASLEEDKEKTSLCENSNTPSSSFEELKHDIKFYTFDSFSEISFLKLKKVSTVIIFENLSKHDVISASIFFPPPNTL
jgi:hypothetical protein